MTIQDCYREIGGDLAQLERRLPSAGLIKKFITKFLDDDSYANLNSAMQAGNREKAFRAAHTLKGVSANLCLGKLLDSTSRLTELLRPESDVISDAAAALFAEVSRDYQLTTDAIRAFLAANRPL